MRTERRIRSAENQCPIKYRAGQINMVCTTDGCYSPSHGVAGSGPVIRRVGVASFRRRGALCFIDPVGAAPAARPAGNSGGWLAARPRNAR